MIYLPLNISFDWTKMNSHIKQSRKSLLRLFLQLLQKARIVEYTRNVQLDTGYCRQA